MGFNSAFKGLTPPPFVTIRPVLGYSYIGARNDTTQQSGQTPDKEVEITNIIVYVSGYTETDTTGMCLPRLSGANKVSLFQADSLARYLLQCA